MKKLYGFCTRHHRLVKDLSFLFLIATVAQIITGCASPTWLNDARAILPILITSAGGVLTFVGSLSGSTATAEQLATLTAIGTEIESGLTDISNLVAQYEENPSDTLLENIDAAVVLVDASLSKIVSDIGLPATEAATIEKYAALIQSQLGDWAALIPAVKALSSAGTTLVASHATFKANVNTLLATPTDSPVVNAALGAVKKL